MFPFLIISKIRYTQQNSSYNFIKKINYLKKRLFLSKEQCRDVFPFIYKHMYLMPFLALYRIVIISKIRYTVTITKIISNMTFPMGLDKT